MKILYVHGEEGEDYAAQYFERNYKVNDIYKQMVKNGNKIILVEDEEDVNTITVELKEFNEVDEEFIEFVKYELMDYDDAKHSNIFVIDESEGDTHKKISFKAQRVSDREWIEGYYVYTNDIHRIIYEDRDGFYCEEEIDENTLC